MNGPLRHPRFRTLWLSESCVLFAYQFLLIGLTLLVIDLEGTGIEVGIVLAAASAPMALTLPIGGALGDRFAVERILVATNTAQFIVTGALAAVVIAGNPPLGVLIALVAVFGAIDGIHFPVAFSAPPRLVERDELTAANALMQGAETVSDLLAPVLAVAAAAAIGLGATFSAIAGLSLLAALVLVRSAIRIPARRDAGIEKPLAGLSAGWHYAKGEPRVLALMVLLAMLSLTGLGPFYVGVAALAEERLGGAEKFGIVAGSYGIGAAIGLALSTRVGAVRSNRGLVVVGTSVLIGLTLVGLGFTQTLGVAIALVAVSGVAEALLDVVLYTWLQEEVPDEVLSRTTSLIILAEVLTDPLSFAGAGLLLGLGVTATLVIAGAAMALSALALAPKLRGL